MCIMDYAYNFKTKNASNEMKEQKPLIYLPNYIDKDIDDKTKNNNKNLYNQQLIQNENININNPSIVQNNQGSSNELDQIIVDITNIMNNKKVVSKKV